jgi:hypothetical protein
MKICLFTNARDEKHIKEWIAHHLNLGFDHVYIFDHKSKVPIKSLLKPNTSVTIERIDYNRELLKFHLMMKARDIALNKYEWMLYLDADEFLIIDKDVHEFMEQYAKYNQVSFNWLVFGNNYLSHEPQGMLMENYTRCSVYASKLIKSFVRPPSIISVITPHVFNTKNMNLSVSGITMKPLNEDGSAQYNINKRYNQLTAYIAHYMYQSYDVYVSRKVNLPRDDKNEFRKEISESELNEISNDVINIDLRDRFVEKNKLRMEEL